MPPSADRGVSKPVLEGVRRPFERGDLLWWLGSLAEWLEFLRWLFQKRSRNIPVGDDA